MMFFFITDRLYIVIFFFHEKTKKAVLYYTVPQTHILRAEFIKIDRKSKIYKSTVHLSKLDHRNGGSVIPFLRNSLETKQIILII